MLRARTSTLGTRGGQPIRTALLSPFFRAGLSPSPVRLGATHQTPGVESCKRVAPAPVRLCDIPEFARSAKKAAKSRRCLYKDDERNNQVHSGQKLPAPVEAVERTLRRPAVIVPSQVKSQIPRSSTMIKGKAIVNNRRVPASKTKSPVSNSSIKPPTTNSVQTELTDLVQELKSIAKEQKNMLDEAKIMFSQFLQEMKSCVEEQKKLLQMGKDSLSSSFIEAQCNEEAKQKDCLADKENSVCRSSQKSASAYKEMRKSFRCLQTPTLSAKKLRNLKLRTPKCSLSSRVQAQLQNLLDD